MNIALVQARTNSSRFPRKIFADLNGDSILDWVLSGIKRSKLIDRVVVAIPSGANDNELSDRLANYSYLYCYRGDENDVISRVSNACLEYANLDDLMIRICGDSPLVSGELIDELISFHHVNRNCYSYNNRPIRNNFPDGLGAEATAVRLLHHLNKVAKDAEREHIYNYIWNNKGKFKVGTYNTSHPELNRPSLKLDVDTRTDLERLRGYPINKNMSTMEIMSRICSQEEAR